MGILSLVKFISRIFGKPSDLVAFVFSILIGYFLSTFLPAGPWVSYTFVLVSYHLFLAWLIVDSSRASGLAMAVIPSILSHLSCVALIAVVSLGVGFIPFFPLFQITIRIAAIVFIARYEQGWLFHGGKTKAQVKVADKKADTVAAAIAASATVDDYEEWLHYLAQPNRPPRKPGTSVQDEYKQWLLARARSRVAAARPKP